MQASASNPVDRRLQVWRRGACIFVGLLFLCTAVAKSWNIPSFVLVTAHLLHLGPRAPAPIAMALVVVAFEVFVAARLLVASPSRRVLGSVFVAVLVFTGALVALAFDPAAPGCGCLGSLRVAHAREDAVVGIVRNFALLALIGWALRSDNGERVRAENRVLVLPPKAVDGRPRGERRAFTIIELLVVVAVLAVLIGLALPALRGAREGAKDARSLSLHRQALAALSMYGDDNRGFFPYFQTPGDPDGPKVLYGFDLPRLYFTAGRAFWANLVVPQYFEPGAALDLDPAGRQQWNAEHGYPEEIIPSRLNVTDTAFALPRYWETDQAPTDTSLLRGTTHADISFPSNKGLTVDILAGVFDPERPNRTAVAQTASVGRGDGSAAFVPWRFDSARAVERPYGALPFQVFSTRGGLGGRDF